MYASTVSYISGNIPISHTPCRVGLVVSVSASHAIGRGFVYRPGHTKDHCKMVQTASLHCTNALGYEFDSAVRLSIRPGSRWNCIW